LSGTGFPEVVVRIFAFLAWLMSAPSVQGLTDPRQATGKREIESYVVIR
jgi:hypothetical protein